MPLQINDTLLNGKFKIVKVLGVGGMGTVYKAEQVGKPGFFRAVKELLIDPKTAREERQSMIERFEREGDLLFSLKHQRIPSYILSFEERGNYYFMMEFVSGNSLEEILEKTDQPLDEVEVVRWMMQVCEALAYIHGLNPPIILRDLKPGNIMVTNDGNIQLVDFGIARRYDPSKRTNTENLGTISYASPEHLGSITSPGQKRSAQNPGRLVQTDARSDIYSLGATMYHLLTNVEPEPIQTPAPGSIRAKNPKLRTISVGGRTICPVEQVIIKAMQQEPPQRFQNAEAMRMALAQCLPSGTTVGSMTIQMPVISPNATIISSPLPQSSQANIICPKCGFSNRPGAKFCKRDGQPLTQGATIVPPQARSQPLRARPIQSSSIRAQPVQSARIQARPVATKIQASQNPYSLGLQNLNTKNYPEAITQFKQAIQPGQQPAYEVAYGLGRAYRQYAQSLKETDNAQYRENLKLAIEQFQIAIQRKADAVDAHFQLGMSYHDLELFDKSIAAFKAAQQITPRDAAIYFQLGWVAMDQGYNLEAEAYFLDGLKINPDHTRILTMLGKLYLKMNQTQSAIHVLRQAMQIETNLWEGWYDLGRAHMKAREWAMALSALEKARQINPDADQIYSAMAQCYIRTNKKAEARQMVHQSLMINPKNSEATRLQKQL